MNTRLTRTEVLNWIAFRRVVDEDLTGLPILLATYQVDTVQEVCSLLDALQKTGEGRPLWKRTLHPQLPEWLTPDSPPDSFIQREEQVRALMITQNKSALELAGELEIALAIALPGQGCLKDAELQLDEAVMEKCIGLVRPPPDRGPYAGRKTVAWYLRQDVLRLWPPAEEAYTDPVFAELSRWYAEWRLLHPDASERVVHEAADQALPHLKIPRAMIRQLLSAPGLPSRKRGRPSHRKVKPLSAR